MEDLFSVGLIFSFTFVFYLLSSYPMYKIAQKAEYDKAFFAWIPILNIVLFLRVAKVSMWVLVLMFIPYVNFIVSIYLVFKLLEAFDKNSILMILFFVFIPIIPYYVLAFDSGAKYKYI